MADFVFRFWALLGVFIKERPRTATCPSDACDCRAGASVAHVPDCLRVPISPDLPGALVPGDCGCVFGVGSKRRPEGPATNLFSWQTLQIKRLYQRC